MENLGRLYCRRNPDVHDRPCRSAGGGAPSNRGRTCPNERRKHSLGGFPTSRTGKSPLLSVHGSRCTSTQDVRIYLRPSLVLDGHALCLCLSGFAALIALPFEFSIDYIQP